jgi:hypothetical protein
MTMLDSPRNRSYGVRDEIATALGVPLYHDFTPSRYLPADEGLWATVEDHQGTRTGWLISTSNAGFRGIEGFFQTPAGDYFHASLGSVTSWSVR